MIWPFSFFYEDVKKDFSSAMYSIVNFYLGCSFCSWLYNSLLSTQGHFRI